MLLPVLIAAAIFLFFLLPQYLRGIHFSGESVQVKQILLRSLLIQSGKLGLFTLFVIYPRLSSGVLRLFVCTSVEDKYYLVADFTQECYTSK
jgi:high-affinity K+ transport system ATPase subunit B